MAIAQTVSDYLTRKNIEYHVLPHPYTRSAIESASAAHVEPEQLAKAVVVRDRGSREHYVMAVLPASREVDVDQLEKLLERRLQLAEEEELRGLFPDCTLGAVPAIGPAYSLPMVIDEALRAQPEVHVEAGDHRELIRVTAEQFRALVPDARYGDFSRESREEYRR